MSSTIMNLSDPFAARLPQRWYTSYIFVSALMVGLFLLALVTEITARAMPADDPAFGSTAGLSTGAYYLFTCLLFGIPHALLLPRRGVRWIGILGLVALMPFIVGIGSFIFRPGHWNTTDSEGAFAASAWLQALILFSGGFAVMSVLVFLGWRGSLLLRMATFCAVSGVFPTIVIRIGYPTAVAPVMAELALIAVTVLGGSVLQILRWRARHRLSGRSSLINVADDTSSGEM